MNLEKLKKALQLSKLLEDEEIDSSSESCECAPVRIVVLQRGWVVIGRYFQSGSKCRIENGYVIRRWGTSEGLGQLAVEGPLAETKLEKTPTIRFHELTIVQQIDCEEKKWLKHCPVA
jgi:hypothetical protein